MSNDRTMIEPTVRYLSQRDNFNPFTGKPEGHNQCMVASFTMLMNWLGDKFERDELSKNYNEHLHLILVGKNEKELESKRYNSSNHAKVCNDYIANLKPKLGAKIFFKSAQLNYDDLQIIFNTKFSPVIVGSMITHHGHILVADENGWQDPYGRADESGRYMNTNGANVNYSEQFCKNFIFREIDFNTKKTIKTNAKRLCWYIEGLVW